MPLITDIRAIKFNDIEFVPIEGVNYRYDYVKLAALIKNTLDKDEVNGDARVIALFRKVILSDLFFILYFVMGIEKANKAFVVDSCREVEDGPKTMTLDVWAREHYKSTIITVGETLQFHLKNSDLCTGIFAYARPLAKSFLRAIKVLCETSEFLKTCFPDVLWETPEVQAPKWSEDDGLVFKRKSAARRESTIEAWGLVEGMPTGRHFDRGVFDDIETQDIAENPDQLNKCFSKFDMAENLGNDGWLKRVIGTFYSHAGPIVKIRDQKNIKGQPMYLTRIKEATEDGTTKGRPVLLSQERIDVLKISDHFYSQQLCDPTPTGKRKLDGNLLIDMPVNEVPKTLHKFMLIDPAGDDDTKASGVRGDDWGVLVIGVEGGPGDDMGARNIYILDAFVDVAGETEIIEVLTRMYLRNGLIMRTGYERNLNTTPGWLIHFLNALKARQVVLSEDRQNLVRLKHGGRNKILRITSALQMPLLFGKIKISTSVPKVYRDVLREELNKFPYWQDGGIDALTYLWDLLDDPYIAQMLTTSPVGSRKPNNVLLFPRGDAFASSSGQGWLRG